MMYCTLLYYLYFQRWAWLRSGSERYTDDITDTSEKLRQATIRRQNEDRPKPAAFGNGQFWSLKHAQALQQTWQECSANTAPGESSNVFLQFIMQFIMLCIMESSCMGLQGINECVPV